MEGGDRASQPSKMKMEMEEDRLSPLPNEIIHHIFSFLDMGSIAHTAFLAKRWRYLYTQTPILNFSIHSWMNYYASRVHTPEQHQQKHRKYIELIDKAMFSATVNITQYNLQLNTTRFYRRRPSSRLIPWLLAALNRDVNIMNLHLPPLQPMELPHQLFTTSSNIEFFTFSSYYWGFGATVRMPRSLSTAPRIQRLSLHGALFPDGDVNGELVMSCPFLEYLHLERCDVSNLKIFNVSTPRLQILEMLSVFTRGGTSCKVKTCTPNLVRLQIRERVMEPRQEFVLDYLMEDLSSLAEIQIDVDTNPENDVRKNMWQWSLVGILLKAPNLQSLHLQSTSLQILTNISGLLQKLPNWFHNLKYVRLDDTCRAPLHTLLKIMRGLPRLETFALSRLSLYEHEPRAEELSFDCIFHHLKSIKIGDFGDRSNDFKFLELLLMKAPVLETVTIDTEIMSCKEDKVELVNKLQALPRASSTLTMICKTDSCDFRSIELQLMKAPVSYWDSYEEDSYDLWSWSL